MNLFEFLSHSGFEDGEFIFVNLLSEDGVADPDLGYKGQLRNILQNPCRALLSAVPLRNHTEIQQTIWRKETALHRKLPLIFQTLILVPL
jgi:hypothetical protein